MRKHIIWDEDINLDDWKDYLDEEFPEADEYDRYHYAEMLNYEYLEDERLNLNIELIDNIVILADLGLWYGHRLGYKNLVSRNIKDCLRHNIKGQSSACWYLDERFDLCCDEAHHDGTNHYLYRMWRPEIKEQARNNFLAKVYEGTATRRDINRYTMRLGDPIAKVYGWKAPGVKKGA